MEPLASPAGPDAASGTLPDKAPAATQPENAPPQPGSAVPASSGDPSELEGAGSQQQGLKDRKKGEACNNFYLALTDLRFGWLVCAPGTTAEVCDLTQLACLGLKLSIGPSFKDSKNLAR